MELYRRYRPQTLDQVIGQDRAVSVLKNKLKDLPHVVLLSGPTGTGKTTIAKILASELECTEHNLIVQNCADVRGIDSVREIDSCMRLAPLGGKCRVWLLEEAVQLPKATQQCFLDILENTPNHVYFLFCTSDTTGLLPTLLGRCFHVQLNSLDDCSVLEIMKRVLEAEKRTMSPAVLLTIVSRASGSGRKALQLLEAALTQETLETQLEAVGMASLVEGEKIEFLASLLLKESKWQKISEALQRIDGKDVEGIRRQILAYMGKVLLSGSNQKPRAFQIGKAFGDSLVDSGREGLIMKCWYLCSNFTRE